MQKMIMSSVKIYRFIQFALFTAIANIVYSSVCHAGDLRPFTSDGCSAFPDGTLQQKNLWLTCCIAHDKAYWMGGTYNEREKADKELERCVAGVGEPEIAKIMLAGVRVGGTPYLPTTYRWGYGWPYPRGYKPLSDNEKNEIARMVNK